MASRRILRISPHSCLISVAFTGIFVSGRRNAIISAIGIARRMVEELNSFIGIRDKINDARSSRRNGTISAIWRNDFVQDEGTR